MFFTQLTFRRHENCHLLKSHPGYLFSSSAALSSKQTQKDHNQDHDVIFLSFFTVLFQINFIFRTWIQYLKVFSSFEWVFLAWLKLKSRAQDFKLRGSGFESCHVLSFFLSLPTPFAGPSRRSNTTGFLFKEIICFSGQLTWAKKRFAQIWPRRDSLRLKRVYYQPY